MQDGLCLNLHGTAVFLLFQENFLVYFSLRQTRPAAIKLLLSLSVLISRADVAESTPIILLVDERTIYIQSNTVMFNGKSAQTYFLISNIK